MKKWIPLFLAVFAVVISAALWIKIHGYVAQEEVVAGVLRSKDERGWYAINDQGHSPKNIHSVNTENGLIVVTYGKEFGRIHTFIAVPDETFAKEGFQVGASVNRSQARILVSKLIDGNFIPIDASSIRSKWGNIWVYGLFESKAN